MRARPYVGMNKWTGRFEVFQAKEKPTPRRCAYIYTHTIGPFRSKVGAAYFAKYGFDNRFCDSISAAERLGKIWKDLFDINRK